MPASKLTLAKRAQNVKLLAMDVDGVLTGGEIIVLNSNEEIKFWNSKDRLAISMLRDHKSPLLLAWITGRSSKAVSWAAEDLGIHHLVQKCERKKEALESILKSHRLRFDEAAYIGDDLIDLPVLENVGLACCPSDAVPDVLKRADYVSSFSGGKGVVRDVLEFILRAQKKWDALVRSFLTS